jgi:thymidylate synthase (FAD)
MSVTLITHMGSDEMVARAAWVSTQRDQREATDEGVEKLIRFLLSNRPAHASPFGHPHVTVLVEAPIFVAREWMRHRVQTFSEVSSRYSDMSGEAYLPPVEDFRTQVGKPGAYHMERLETEQAEAARKLMAVAQDNMVLNYRFLMDKLGVAREVARNVLPLSTMTRFYATASLRNWLGFLILRNHPAALLEIRREAEALEGLLAGLFPITLRVWQEEGRPPL